MSTTTKIVTGVDYVGIPTNDIETAREFYENVLGLEASSVWQRPGEAGGRRGVRDRHGDDRADQLPGPGHPVQPEPGAARAAGRRRRRRARRARVTRGRRSTPTRSTAASATWPTSRTPTATRSCCITATPPRAEPARSGRDFEHDVELAVDVRVGERDARARALEQQVHARVADAELLDLDAVDPARQRRPPDPQRPLERRRRAGRGRLVSRYGIAPAAHACGRQATG